MSWDAPNQQVVRADASGPWEEGSGGGEQKPAVDLSSLTKAELLDQADAEGVTADDSMTKAQIIERLEAP